MEWDLSVYASLQCQREPGKGHAPIGDQPTKELRMLWKMLALINHRVPKVSDFTFVDKLLGHLDGRLAHASNDFTRLDSLFDKLGRRNNLANKACNAIINLTVFQGWPQIFYIPRFKASVAVKLTEPVKTISMALDLPTALTRRWVPPAPKLIFQGTALIQGWAP